MAALSTDLSSLRIAGSCNLLDQSTVASTCGPFSSNEGARWLRNCSGPCARVSRPVRSNSSQSASSRKASMPSCRRRAGRRRRAGGLQQYVLHRVPHHGRQDQRDDRLRRHRADHQRPQAAQSRHAARDARRRRLPALWSNVEDRTDLVTLSARRAVRRRRRWAGRSFRKSNVSSGRYLRRSGDEERCGTIGFGFLFILCLSRDNHIWLPDMWEATLDRIRKRVGARIQYRCRNLGATFEGASRHAGALTPGRYRFRANRVRQWPGIPSPIPTFPRDSHVERAQPLGCRGAEHHRLRYRVLPRPEMPGRRMSVARTRRDSAR